MAANALGKGLSALIPERIESSQDITISTIEISKIRNSKFQPRIDYNEEKLNELKNSIKEKGMLQPILVRAKGDVYEVIAGERRLRAARELKLQQVPAIIKEVSDQEALVIALIENIQREELNPIEEAEAYKKLIEDFQYSQEEVANSVGKDRSTISNLLRLLRLPKDIQKAVLELKITMGHARALLGCESSVDLRDLYEQILSKNLSVRDVENLIRSASRVKSKKVSKKIETTPEIRSLENELQQAIGTKVTVLANKKKGKVIIEYYSLDDLDRIIWKLKK